MRLAFLKSTTPLALALVVSQAAAQNIPKQEAFLYGASTYPELLNREQWNSMLDEFQKAKFNTVRVADGSWGNLEPAPGQYNFGWLRQYLDDLNSRYMKAVLGTGSFVAPQWLTGRNREILVQLQPGYAGPPMSRKAACINNPKYRDAVRRFVTTLAKEFKDHPAVIGWQLDNEVEYRTPNTCYCDACERSWRAWLERTYGSPANFNERWKLESWGMRITSFDEVPQPRKDVEDGIRLPALTLANLHFRRDCILDFLVEQREAIRGAGSKQWITTDWNTIWTALADDPRVPEALDATGINFYQPSAESPDFWKMLGWQLDMHRSAHGWGHFVVTETRTGVAGSTVMDDAFPGPAQFRMWMLQPAAFGASGLLFWSGNRFRGGHWPHWGGLLDWTGQPEPDFPWVIELGRIYERLGERMVKNLVRATVSVVTDFDQRAALDVYPHTPSSQSVMTDTFDALHRLGIGADCLNTRQAADPAVLAKYSLIILVLDTALDGSTVPAALKQYVENGGEVLITPFTAYQSWHGLFRGDGFGANLAPLTNAVVRTARRMGTSAESGRSDQQVVWSGAVVTGMSPVGVDGYCEYLETRGEVETLAAFRSDVEILNGRPAAIRNRLGKGQVVKLAFWPKDDSILRLLTQLAHNSEGLLAAPLPPGVQAVPRTDGSLFVINTTRQPAAIEMRKPVLDRLSRKTVTSKYLMDPYAVLWVE